MQELKYIHRNKVEVGCKKNEKFLYFSVNDERKENLWNTVLCFFLNGFCVRQYLKKKLFDLHPMPRILAFGLWRPLFYGTVRFGKD